MVDFDLNARHACLARRIVNCLTKSVPRFPYIEIANMCLDEGLFNLHEADRLRKEALFPDWFVKFLDEYLPQPLEIENSTSKNYDLLSLCEAGKLTLTRPMRQSVSGLLTKHFTSKTISTQKLFVARGNFATHFIHPNISISWSDDGMIEPRKDWSERFTLNSIQNLEPRHLPGRTFLCPVRASAHFGHWLLDTFPRFLALIEAGEDINQIDQFVLINTKHDFQKNMLKDLGIGPERIVRAGTRGQLYSTDEFVFVSNPRNNYVPCAITFDMICSYFRQPRDNSLRKRKIFISRSKARWRHLLNEDEVLAFLEPMGYERVYMEDFDIREAARIMAEAEAVIAPHGSALANFVFATQGTKILELFGAHLTTELWLIANQKKLNYYAFEADGPDGKKLDPNALEKMPTSKRNHMDMSISMKDFRDFVVNEFERDK